MNKSSRREFLRHTGLAAGLGTLGGVWSDAAPRPSKSPNEKLNIACIGIGGQGASDVRNVSSENIVALCDVDFARGQDSFKAFPKAKQLEDWRRVIEMKDVDAVTITTPDHLHAVITSAAMKAGKHVYTQKPLAHSVKEARELTNLAKRYKVATQMGTQNHAHPSYCRTVELLQKGAIGNVSEAHVVTDRPIWPQGMSKPSQAMPVPISLNWDLWLGPAADRPYHSSYLPFAWRGWWDFGTGAPGDMACHLMDPSFWALDLTYPTAVSAKSETPNPYSCPKWSIITYEFPKRGAMPPVKLIWYDGGALPDPALHEDHPLVNNRFNGTLFVGEKGKLLIEHGKEPILLPEKNFKDYKGPEPYLDRTIGHHAEWIAACKTGRHTGSNFGYAGPMTEAILLGNIAVRVGARIEYDAKAMKIKGNPAANALIDPPYRAGYSL